MSDWLVADSLAPNPVGALAPLYAGAGRGELVLPHCAACNLALELDQQRCDACGSDAIAWTVVEPTGTVHSTTTVHRRQRGLIVTDRPYHVVDVELASGHRVIMTTEHATDVAPTIGQRAQIAFRHIAGISVPALATTSSEEAS